MNELEKIENQIKALKWKALEIRNSAPKPSFDFNNEIHLQVRANRLKISTVKKEVTKTNKIKIKKMASIKVTRPKAESKAMNRLEVIKKDIQTQKHELAKINTEIHRVENHLKELKKSDEKPLWNS